MKIRHERRVLAAGGVFGMLLAALAAMPEARAGWAEEEALDALFGLLQRPWVLAYQPSRTRLYLQTQARVSTGLPAYDQHPEHADRSPAALYESLKSPAPAPRSRPRGEEISDPGTGKGNDYKYPDPDPHPGYPLP